MKFIVIALLGLSVRLYGTAIIAVRWQDGIVIGADSNQTYFNGSPAKPACKIIAANDVIFAYSGFSETPMLGATDSIVMGILQRKGTLRSRIDRFGEIVRPGLLALAQDFRISNPQYFDARILNNALIEIVFATISKAGIPQLFARSFLARLCVGNLVIQDFTWNCPAPNFGPQCYFALGQHQGVDEEIAAHPATVWKPTVVEAIRHLLTIQTKRTPVHVGGAFTIVFIEPKQTTWVQSGLCQH